MRQAVKRYTTNYLYFMAVFGGIAWAAHFYITHQPTPNLGQDYLYEQQQELGREINALQLQLKAVVPE